MTSPSPTLPTSAEGEQSTLTRDAADFHRAMLDFVRIYQFRDRDRTESHNVSASAAHILEALTRLGPVSLNRLATELFVEKSTASRLVSGLEEKGYVSRVADPEDRRALRLELTPAGRELQERINADALLESTEMLRLFSGEIRRGMIGRIRQIAAVSATRAGFTDASCCRISIDMGGASPLDVDLRVASPGDLGEAVDLVEAQSLPTAGLKEHFPTGYIVARDSESRVLAGLAGLERDGADGLLRVVIVRPAYRGAGLARALVLAAMDLARVIAIRDLYVVSRIAPKAFARMGWEEMGHEDLPGSLRASDGVRDGDFSTATVLRWRVSRGE